MSEAAGTEGPFFAIVVLGASVRPDGRPSPSLGARLEAARAAFAQARADRVIVTGRGEAEVMANELVRSGVPRAQITLEPQARSTRGNARRVAALVPAGARLLVVTQAAHLPRALGLFRAAGTEPSPLVAADHWGTWPRVRERLAYLHHRLVGWI